MLQKDLRKALKRFILGIIFGGWGLDGLNDVSRSCSIQMIGLEKGYKFGWTKCGFKGCFDQMHNKGWR